MARKIVFVASREGNNQNSIVAYIAKLVVKTKGKYAILITRQDAPYEQKIIGLLAGAAIPFDPKGGYPLVALLDEGEQSILTAVANPTRAQVEEMFAMQ
jgi:hypothetical protein